MNNVKKPWTADEEHEMMSSVTDGQSFDVIARRHQRTQNAIQLRFGMVCKKELATRSLEGLSSQYHMEPKRILQYMDGYDAIQNRQQQPPAPQAVAPAPMDLLTIREEIRSLHEKCDRIYRALKKLLGEQKKR